MESQQNIRPINIEDEIRSSYLDYSMSVIIGRALPDVRDGLKPVHRRVLYSMHELNLEYGKAYKKSARVVGDCIGKYHPHGDVAVYDTLVRMAQDFSMRYPLVDGQGNFGSVDGDPPAAMRYTEVRMARITGELLADLEKDTINFQPNYDNSLQEPMVLPTIIPNLLINGASGIAVGMSTNIPPHSLREVVDGAIALIRNPNITVSELIELIPGPDFPTGGFIIGHEGIQEAYRTGRGIVTMRGRAMVEKLDKGERESIVITEIPFQLNKVRLIETIADLVREKRIEGITEIRDESDREGMRIVLELKRDARAAVILKNLYKHTPLQSSFGIIMLAIVQGQPEVLSLKQVLGHFISHRKEVVVRRTKFELRKAEERAHILEGFKIALDHLDQVIEIIRGSANPATARERLVASFGFSDRQAQAILDLRLHRLTSMERDKILEEYRQILLYIEDLRDILAKEHRIFEIITQELVEIREKYGDIRRTQILNLEPNFSEADLIPEEEMVVTISHQGYIKRNPISLYRAQKRGGRGKVGMGTKEEDFVEDLFVASTHDYLLVFTTKGRMYWLKVYDIPQAGRASRGRPIVNVIDLQPGEKVAAVVASRTFDDDRTVVMVTRKGIIKQTELSAFGNVRAAGLIACTVDENDELYHVRLAQPGQDILLASLYGKAIRFPGSDVRTMGRTARGVRGMDLKEGDVIIGVEVLEPENLPDDVELERVDEVNVQVEGEEEDERVQDDVGGPAILTVTEKGYGKRTPTLQYRRQGRGGMGIIDIRTGERNGMVVGMAQVLDTDEVMLITNTGKILRTRADQIRKVNRNTLGVRLMNLERDERVVGLARLMESDEEDVVTELVGLEDATDTEQEVEE